MSGRTAHERNPTLHAPREGADYVRCRTCAKCLAILRSEAPWALSGDLGLCEDAGFAPVDLDEPRRGADAECWEQRP